MASRGWLRNAKKRERERESGSGGRAGAEAGSVEVSNKRIPPFQAAAFARDERAKAMETMSVWCCKLTCTSSRWRPPTFSLRDGRGRRGGRFRRRLVWQCGDANMWRCNMGESAAISHEEHKPVSQHLPVSMPLCHVPIQCSYKVYVPHHTTPCLYTHYVYVHTAQHPPCRLDRDKGLW